jgi:hypothetical protein
MMTAKITEQHLSRMACIYIRQSTPAQVRFNQQSTERQYNLAAKAQTLGWSPERVRVLDRDLGQSGARSSSREDFKALVSDVAMGNVGAILSLEACLLRLPSPPIEKLQQCILVGIELLQGLALDAGNDPGYDPTRLAHFDHDDQRVTHVEGHKGSAQVIQLALRRLPHWGGSIGRSTSAPMGAIARLTSGSRWMEFLAARPIASTPADRAGARVDCFPAHAAFPNGRRVGIRIVTFEACSGFTRVTARRIAQPPKVTFVTRLQPSQLPGQAARQLPDLSTIIRVEPSSTDDSRRQGALP